MELSHSGLVLRAGKWLKSQGCNVVLLERKVLANIEIPDAIGFFVGYRGAILIECKTSINDYYADRRKPFRKKNWGMGWRRYYLTNKGLLKSEQIIDGWGLLEIRPKQIRRIKESHMFNERDHNSEERMLVSEIFRLNNFMVNLGE